MANLNAPSIDPGPLTAADLDRATNTGRIFPVGLDQQGRYATRQLPAEACSELGAEDCDPPFSRVGLILILCTGIPFLGAIVGALIAWLPGV